MKYQITVEYSDEPGCGCGYTVRKDDRYHWGLCWDEMLCAVVELTHPKIGVPRFPMLTKAEWDEEERKHQEKLKRLQRV